MNVEELCKRIEAITAQKKIGPEEEAELRSFLQQLLATETGRALLVRRLEDRAFGKRGSFYKDAIALGESALIDISRASPFGILRKSDRAQLHCENLLQLRTTGQLFAESTPDCCASHRHPA